MFKIPDNPNSIEMVKVDFPLDEYYQDVFPKTQFVLHHSAGNDNGIGMFKGWEMDKSKVATAYGIDSKGVLFKGYESKYWAAHIGYCIRRADGSIIGGNDKAYKLVPGSDTREFNRNIEHRTIGVEILNWGGLKLINGKYYAWPSKTINPLFKSDVIIPEDQVVYYKDGFRGSLFFQKYTEKQIETTWKLLRLKCKEHNIECKFKGFNFDLNVDAIKGVSGIYSHVNYRADKQDCSPQPELIEMLKAL